MPAKRNAAGVGLCLATLLYVSLHAFSAQAEAARAHPRPMVVDDLFRLESFSFIAPSPDGEWLAVTVIRPALTAGRYWPSGLGRFEDRGDVWLVERSTGERHRLTDGAKDGSGYWNPQWSPDGRRLAMLCTIGRRNIHLCIWDRSSGRVRQVTSRGMDLRAIVAPENVAGTLQRPLMPFRWLDSRTLLGAVVAEGKPSTWFHSERQSAWRATHAWTRAEGGVESTESALDSGIDEPSRQPVGALLAIDALTNTSRTLLEGDVLLSVVSPTRAHAAVKIMTGWVAPRANERLERTGIARTRMAIVSLAASSKAPHARWLDDVAPEFSFGDETGSDSWSSDGATYAMLGTARVDNRTNGRVFLVTAATGVAQEVGADEIGAGVWRASGTSWMGDGTLLLRGLQIGQTSENTQAAREDWWALSANNSTTPRNLTRELTQVPRVLLHTASTTSMLALQAGALWKFTPGEISLVKHPVSGLPTSARIVWPDAYTTRTAALTTVVLESRERETNTLWSLDLSDGSTTSLALPDPAAALVGYIPEHDQTLFTASRDDGTFLWLSEPRGSAAAPLIKLNAHLAQIQCGRHMFIDYRGVEGDNLRALVLLPPGHQAGRRYPTVVEAYAGAVIAQNIHNFYLKSTPIFLNMCLMAARGYVALKPSMPLGPSAVPDDRQITSDDVNLELHKGAMPAIDKLIELGIADPDRLSVMGYSFGGFSTYSLVTYTKRFKAAIAGAGPSDYVSLAGTFTASERYGEDPYMARAYTAGVTEHGQPNFGVPPSADLWKYLRNSPIFYLDRIDTPLLIFHGDLDVLPITQAEEVFSGLYRLGKRARFARYWGEGHGIQSPANIRALWRQIIGWLDEWCDITRDSAGDLVFEGDRVKSRKDPQ